MTKLAIHAIAYLILFTPGDNCVDDMTSFMVETNPVLRKEIADVARHLKLMGHKKEQYGGETEGESSYDVDFEEITMWEAVYEEGADRMLYGYTGTVNILRGRALGKPQESDYLYRRYKKE